MSRDSVPVTGGVVELWGSRSLISNAVTSASGRFTLPDTAGGRAIWVRAIGFRPARHDLTEISANATIVLQPMVFDLAQLQTKSAPICPARETREGRAAITRMAAQYSRTIDSLGLATYFRGSFSKTSDPGLGAADSTLDAVGQTGSSARGRQLLTAQVEREGYASPSQGGMGSAYGAWEYASLHRILTQHWIDPVFLKRHHFYIRSVSDGDTVLGFCPAKTGQPAIEGILELDSSMMLVRAAWTYRIKGSKEIAGGEAIFAPAGAEQEPALLPVAGAYWRELVTSLYYQERYDFVRWVPGQGDSIPRLPRWEPVKRTEIQKGSEPRLRR